MTEKRFTYKHFDWLQWHIYKDGEFFIEVTNCEEDAKKLCELLNELHEENEQLKQSYKEFEDECQSTFNAMSRKQNDLYRKNFKLKEENEQLKFDKQQLHRAISREEVRHKQFQDKVFDLIDEKIKEADEGLKQTYDSWYQGKIDVLAELKKELSE